jgi:hypothetical protein
MGVVGDAGGAVRRGGGVKQGKKERMSRKQRRARKGVLVVVDNSPVNRSEPIEQSSVVKYSGTWICDAHIWARKSPSHPARHGENSRSTLCRDQNGDSVLDNDNNNKECIVAFGQGRGQGSFWCARAMAHQ